MKLVANTLPARYIPSYRMPLQDLSYLFYNQEHETIDRVFLLFPFNTVLWSIFQCTMQIQAHRDMSMADWIKILLGVEMRLNFLKGITHAFLFVI